MKIYTRGGDGGDTALFGGARCSKADSQVAAYGTVDELNAVLGWLRLALRADDLQSLVAGVQDQLFRLGAELATARSQRKSIGIPLLDAPSVVELERLIDHYDSQLPALKTFILPGGSEAGARLHVARTVCRRAERCIVALTGQLQVRPVLVAYINRLGDLLFVLARYANYIAGVHEEPWLGATGAGRS